MSEQEFYPEFEEEVLPRGVSDAADLARAMGNAAVDMFGLQEPEQIQGELGSEYEWSDVDEPERRRIRDLPPQERMEVMYELKRWRKKRVRRAERIMRTRMEREESEPRIYAMAGQGSRQPPRPPSFWYALLAAIVFGLVWVFMACVYMLVTYLIALAYIVAGVGFFVNIIILILVVLYFHSIRKPKKLSVRSATILLNYYGVTFAAPFILLVDLPIIGIVSLVPFLLPLILVPVGMITISTIIFTGAIAFRVFCGIFGNIKIIRRHSLSRKKNTK